MGSNYIFLFLLNQKNDCIYKNGVLAQTIAAGRPMTDVAWRLGGNGNSPATETWKGFLGYFSAYTKSLSGAEVMQNYNALKSRFE